VLKEQLHSEEIFRLLK